MPPNWKRAIVQACTRGEWQRASAIAAGMQLDKAGWRKVAEYIEGEKAKALAELTRQWREGRGK